MERFYCSFSLGDLSRKGQDYRLLPCKFCGLISEDVTPKESGPTCIRCYKLKTPRTLMTVMTTLKADILEATFSCDSASSATNGKQSQTQYTYNQGDHASDVAAIAFQEPETDTSCEDHISFPLEQFPSDGNTSPSRASNGRLNSKDNEQNRSLLDKKRALKRQGFDGSTNVRDFTLKRFRERATDNDAPMDCSHSQYRKHQAAKSTVSSHEVLSEGGVELCHKKYRPISGCADRYEDSKSKSSFLNGVSVSVTDQNKEIHNTSVCTKELACSDEGFASEKSCQPTTTCVANYDVQYSNQRWLEDDGKNISEERSLGPYYDTGDDGDVSSSCSESDSYESSFYYNPKIFRYMRNIQNGGKEGRLSNDSKNGNDTFCFDRMFLPI